MAKQDIKQGDVVTVKLEDNNLSSNTYLVARKLEGESLLNHPLAPDMYVIRKDEELNDTLAQLKSDEERQLEYCVKYQKYLGFDAYSVMTSLILFYVMYRKMSARQKKLLSDICGEIAAVYCNNDLSIALRTVNENQALLNEFNLMWYRNLRSIFQGRQRAERPGQVSAIYNMAGFVLAQLEGK